MVLSSPKVRFSKLMTVGLRGVTLTSGHLEGILSSCSNLKKLTIEDSKLPYKLRLAGTVTTVVILECVGGKGIDLRAAYLRPLECKIKNDMRFFFYAGKCNGLSSATRTYLVIVQEKEICLVSKTSRIRRSTRPPPSPTCHAELKQVRYGGFYGPKAEMDFVLYILRSATVLEQMFLSPRYKDYFCSAGGN
ncbi:hypothetical protein CQW23_10921 [Capsicum baccatum]|uniref:FBD domain-containing protein n=1 Tax=Capsicum baccatum TaxID=33114 RepID=A0A2G2X110_CAPBA|nr:hypothetical protein CQW23_10921 [Capsicum baccatum]